MRKERAFVCVSLRVRSSHSFTCKCVIIMIPGSSFGIASRLRTYQTNGDSVPHRDKTFCLLHVHERLFPDGLCDVSSLLCRVAEAVFPDGQRPERGASPSCNNIEACWYLRSNMAAALLLSTLE